MNTQTPTYKVFHAASANTWNAPPPKVDEWPEQWKRIYYKGYPRFDRIALPEPCALNVSLGSLLHDRRSRRDFASQAVTLQQISDLLQGAAITAKAEDSNFEAFRAYPSAGARYPLEIYVLVREGQDIAKGIYHYHVRSHSLERLWDLPEASLREVFPYQDLAEKAPVTFVISAMINRTAIKYGERAYRYALFEAGHLSQNLCLIAAAKGVSAVPFGGFHDENLSRLLDLNPDEELVLYSIVVGKA